MSSLVIAAIEARWRVEVRTEERGEGETKEVGMLPYKPKPQDPHIRLGQHQRLPVQEV